MTKPADTVTTNIVPVQGIFKPEPTFDLITFIGPAGTPFLPPTNPIVDGVTITNSTINSSVIGGSVPAAGTFTNIATTTGTISTLPSNSTDIANKQYVDSVAQGLNVKAACLYSTTGNITLSGLGTQANGDWTSSLSAGDRVLVKNQASAQFNGIYVAAASSWARSSDMDTWAEVPSAFTFVQKGTTLADTGWVCTSDPGGTIDVTAINWSQFSGAGSYLAGNGLQLTGNTFSVLANGTTINVSSSGIKLSDTYPGQSSITTVGTLTAGTWNANTIGVGYGGTGLTSYTIGDLIVASGTTTLTQLSDIATGNVLLSGGVGVSPSYGKVGLTTHVSGILPIANGGTNNNATPTAGTVVYGTGTALEFTAVGTSGQYLKSNNSGAPTWETFPISVSSFSAGTTGFSPSSPTTGAVTLSGTLNVANGGTGVTVSSGANSVVLRDANNNITANAYFNGFTSVAASGTAITLTVASTSVYLVTGSGGQTIKLPDATTLPNGTIFSFNNNQSSGAITVNNNSNTLIVSVPSGGYTTVVLLSNAIAAGSWDRHDQTPSNVSWSTNTFDYPGSITSATWNGAVVAYNRGGTGQSAAFVAGGVVYGATTSAMAVTAVGTSGQVLQSNGSSAPSWVTPTAYATVTDDTTTNATRYPLFANQTTGNLSTEYVSSTKYQFNPSTGILTATGFSGSASGLTSIPAGQLTGTIPSAVLGNSSVYIGTTSIALNRSSASQSLTGVSIDGSAGSATTATTATNANNVAVTDDTTTNTDYYVTWVNNTSGNRAISVSSTKLKFNPSSGVMTVTGGIGGGNF
jgi:hypothetical protein